MICSGKINNDGGFECFCDGHSIFAGEKPAPPRVGSGDMICKSIIQRQKMSRTGLFSRCFFCNCLFDSFFHNSPFGYGSLAGVGGFHIVRHLERGIPHLLADGTRADTLSADADGFRCSVGSGRPNVLQIRQERPPGDASYLCTDSAEIFRLTSRFDAISKTTSLPTNLTNTCHCNAPTENFAEF